MWESEIMETRLVLEISLYLYRRRGLGHIFQRSMVGGPKVYPWQGE